MANEVCRYAHVKNGAVVTVSLWDGVTPWTPGDGSTLHQLEDDSPVGPGWQLVDGDWVAPEPDDLDE
jgi:hypothetical protein